jgi:hypothetical protein
LFSFWQYLWPVGLERDSFAMDVADYGAKADWARAALADAARRKPWNIKACCPHLNPCT